MNGCLEQGELSEQTLNNWDKELLMGFFVMYAVECHDKEIF